MIDSEVIERLRHLISEFKQNEEHLLNALRKIDFDDPIFETMNKLVVQIKEGSAPLDILKVDDLSLRNDLIAVRENKDFVYFQCLNAIKKIVEPENVDRLTFEPDWNEFYKNRWDDILSDEILPKVDPFMLVMKRMDVGALLVGKDLPDHLKMHLVRIKECYAWGFATEAAIYCRTILEEAFREVLKLRVTHDLNRWTLYALLKESEQKGYFYKEVIDRSHNVRENVNKIVHPGSKKLRVKMSELEIIKDTFYILEMLFR